MGLLTALHITAEISPQELQQAQPLMLDMVMTAGGTQYIIIMLLCYYGVRS
jgi:hypothetical protein